MSYYVYILLCEDGSYYAGYTKDVKHRVERHRKGRGARYTKMHQPERVVYIEEFKSRSKAMKRKQEVKSLGHNQKQQLTNLYEMHHEAPSIRLNSTRRSV